MSPGNSYEPASTGDCGRKEPRWKTKKWLIPVVSSIVVVLIITIILLATLLPSSSSSLFPKTGFIHFPALEKICFNPDDPSSYREYVSVLNSTIEPYENTKIEGNMIDCSKKEPQEGEVCFITDTWLNNCKKQALWGYKDATPCVVLSYHDDLEFNPVPYGNSDKLPDKMPEDLKTKIRDSTNKALWVSCTRADQYNPYPGFLISFFPIRNVSNYLSPLIGVEFELPEEGGLDVTCSLWSRTASGDPVDEISFKIGKNC